MTRRPVSLSRRLSERSRAGDPPPASGAAPAMGAMLEGLQRVLGGLQDAISQAEQAPDAERKLVFGYSLKVGPLGAEAEPFGHVAPRARADGGREAGSPAAREPITDVFEEADAILVIAEVPGAEAERVTATLDADGALLIDCAGPQAYRKRIPLPAKVDGAGLAMACRNGILEIRLPRAEAGA
ncbi:Hsp20/alpha crystallin family protein [Paracraurococcus ruber]|uniref:Hsp20/alpha crystallin family protein n=1 Tax=Paracraurococcus ruber TaxID=77675 RepID=UPI0013053705|nr:hypothetical protein [Paracraurococcus ruber]